MDKIKTKQMEFSTKITFFISLICGVVITCVIFLVWHVVLSGLIHVQVEKNLQRHLLVLEKMLGLMEYDERQQNIIRSKTQLHFMKTLRHQNEKAALILTELKKPGSKQIEFSTVKFQDGVIWVEGFSPSDGELIAWIESMKGSSLLTYPVITSIENKNSLRYFQLRMGLKS